MKLQWLSHSGFKVTSGSRVLLVDPFLSGNGQAPFGWEEAANDVTHILLTHGHADHVGDTLDIAKASGATVVGMVELVNWLKRQWADLPVEMANMGGTINLGEGHSVTLVPAWHSSGAGEDGAYTGMPAGLIIKTPEQVVYHAGDTGVFGDMALIHEMYKPTVGLVPIGDRFTMDAKGAAFACKKFFDFKTIVPIHYGTFPIIAPDADTFVKETAGLPVHVMKPGETLEL